VKRAFRILLVISAFIGLLGQQGAYALGPAVIDPLLTEAAAPQEHHQVGMMMDCAEMMAQHPDEPGKGDRRCKGLTLACIAQMGCTIPVLLGSGPVANSMAPILPIRFEPAIMRPLGSRSFGPEPEPPTMLS
jgi:hypothetical protein